MANQLPSSAPEQTAAGVENFASDPLAAYGRVRQTSGRICAPLERDDYGLQSMESASPPKWHLAHTTWFFETFVLAAADPAYKVFHERFGYLFNSYYETVGQMHPRPLRGLLSRPTVTDVYRYREHVDEHLQRRLEDGQLSPELLEVLELGLHHEQQHQELLLTDLKHAFSLNSLLPAYRRDPHARSRECAEARWVDHSGGVAGIGAPDNTFSFDNEGPRHRVFLEPFGLQSRLITCGEYLEFMADGGYERADLWLSNGWAEVQQRGWRAPLYWHDNDGQWQIFTLDGLRDVDPHEPVCHVSLYEADAYARWTGYRLPTEFEWEISFRERPRSGNDLESGVLHPRAASTETGLLQGFGDTWEWTGSAYAAYPAYRAPKGALGEYNGKFMCSQVVLRGGSCVTPGGHIRPSYRNFFYPQDRWQFSGIRLARDL